MRIQVSLKAFILLHSLFIKLIYFCIRQPSPDMSLIFASKFFPTLDVNPSYNPLQIDFSKTTICFLLTEN
jgi:hypothetical protein